MRGGGGGERERERERERENSNSDNLIAKDRSKIGPFGPL